jgi:adenine-specific DNA-methyltransferase
MFYKGLNRGKPSSNPLGKNPSDVWEIPVVNSNHVEKTPHPCQFPQALAQRLILSLTHRDDVVFDPFMGSGTTAKMSILLGRNWIGSELDTTYSEICRRRLEGAIKQISMFDEYITKESLSKDK